MSARRAATGWGVAGGIAAVLLIAGIATASNPPGSEPAETDAVAVLTPSASPSPTPVKTTTRVDVDVAIPFTATTVEDANRDVGTSEITTPGRDGVKTSTYVVTLVDGVETGRSLLSERISTAPVDQVTAVGTRQPAPPAAAPEAPSAAGGCDPNYAGACVPIDSASTARAAAATGRRMSVVRSRSWGRTSTTWTGTATGSAASSGRAWRQGVAAERGS